MPSCSTVAAELSCPYCASKIDHEFEFQWGQVPYHYRLGDTIRWYRRRKGDPITCWRLYNRFWFLEPIFNAGDPSVENVLALECHCYAPSSEPKCPRCAEAFDGAIVTIRASRIAEARILKRGELQSLMGTSQGAAALIVVRPDGTLWPRHDWEDVRLQVDESWSRFNLGDLLSVGCLSGLIGGALVVAACLYFAVVFLARML